MVSLGLTWLVLKTADDAPVGGQKPQLASASDRFGDHACSVGSQELVPARLSCFGMNFKKIPEQGHPRFA